MPVAIGPKKMPVKMMSALELSIRPRLAFAEWAEKAQRSRMAPSRSRRLGRHGQTVQSTIRLTTEVVSCCATRAQMPAPASASETPTMPLITAASRVRIATDRNCNWRRSTASGTMASPCSRTSGESARQTSASPSGAVDQPPPGQAE